MDKTTTAKFDPNGGNLFIQLEMKGLYRIVYQYDLWSLNKGQPVILTKTPFKGNNEKVHDDSAQIINEYDSAEPLENYDGREVEVSFKIINRGSNDGYRVGVVIKQGIDMASAVVIGEHWEPAMKDKEGKAIKPKKLGKSQMVGEEYIVIKLEKL